MTTDIKLADNEVVTDLTVSTYFDHIAKYFNTLSKCDSKSKEIAESSVRIKVIASTLVLAITKGIKENTLKADTHNILTGNIQLSSFTSKHKVNQRELDVLNKELKAIADKAKQDSTDKSKPLSEVEEAQILSDKEETVKVETAPSEWIIIDKVKGTISMYLEKTKETFTKDIKDFKKKSWREIATGIIDAIIKGFKKIKEYTFDKPIKAIKNFFKKKSKVDDAQPSPTPSKS